MAESISISDATQAFGTPRLARCRLKNWPGFPYRGPLELLELDRLLDDQLLLLRLEDDRLELNELLDRLELLRLLLDQELLLVSSKPGKPPLKTSENCDNALSVALSVLSSYSQSVSPLSIEASLSGYRMSDAIWAGTQARVDSLGLAGAY